ncbi:MAG: rod shape-determining protein MreD [Candidatus Merdivicinus sp.]|jgi:rod shape-determining protein MreD
MTIGRNTRIALKWICYTLVLLLMFGIQSSPALLSIGGIKPVLVIPVAVSVALFENEAGSGGFGLAAGLLWDLSAGKLFGFYGMVLMICCVCIALLSMYFVKVNVTNSILLTAVTGFLATVWNFIFYYLIWNYEGVGQCFVRLLLVLLYTIVMTAPVYYLVRFISVRFNPVVRA